jgi:Escherichia/Staphylococcus phage prohead protease
MNKLRKTYDLASFKALDAEQGTFEALVSIFGTVDFQGDRVIKGAFSKSIGEWRASGDPVPVIWSHDWADPFAHIGSVDPQEMEETDRGLKVRGQLDIDKPFGRQVFDLLKARRVKQWSFAYDIIRERPARDRANELQEVKILELGPTLSGANQETDTLAVKGMLEDAAHAKAGRVLSSKNESALRQARDLLDGVLAVLADPEKEKAAAKPWTIQERDGEFCVVAEDGETVDCHESREEAEAQMRALYANEKAETEPEVLEPAAKSRETEQGRAEREAFKERLERLAVGL